jgi:class 3 adenylate cyclase
MVPEASADLPPAPSNNAAFRTILGLGTAATLLTRMPSWQHPDLVLVGGALAAVLYVAISELLLWRRAHPITATAQDILGHVDALLLGLLVGALQFPLLLLTVLLTLTQCYAFLRGGGHRWVRDNLAFAAGAAAAAVVQPDLQLQLEAPLHVVPAGVFALFLILYGHRTLQQSGLLRNRIEDLKREQISLKLHNYQLAKYVSPNLREGIESGKAVKLSSQRKRIVVFFSDIVGFSEIADEMDESALTQVINDYLTQMSKIALEHGGTIDKFIGDAVMVFFGDPQPRGPKEDCLACVTMAIAMRNKVAELQAHWRNLGLMRPMQVRMGISTGFCTVGNFGTESRLHYTLLGSEVNLASRLETAAEPGEILVSHATWQFVRDQIMCRDRGEMEVKGFKHPIKVYAVVDHRKNLGSEQSCLDYRTEGFSLFMDLEHIRNYDYNKVASALRDAFREVQRKFHQPPTP